MSSYSPWYALACAAMALLTVALLTRFAPSWGLGSPAQAAPGQPRDGHFAADGLRGLLMLSLFAGHAASWLGFRQTGRWAVPPSVAYTYLTQAAVVGLFLLTGALYGLKLVRTRGTRLDWFGLWLGRLRRLGPAYLVAMGLLFVITWVFGQGPAGSTPASAYLAWLLFCIPGMPVLHGLQATPQVMAGATWTLPYGCLFYLALPGVALLLRQRVSAVPLLLGAALVAAIVAMVPHYSLIYLLFGLGLLLGGLSGWPPLQRVLSHPLAVLPAVAAVALAVVWSPATAYAPGVLLLLGLAFWVVAGGNSLCGLLRWPALQVLGRAGYSFFLLHGPILFVGLDLVAKLTANPLHTPGAFWLAVAGLMPLAVLASLACYRWVERPAWRR